MFFGGDRITAVREMILADDEAGRRRALDKLLPMQRADFAGIFRSMGERPVTVRTLDPPLHEFMPHTEAEQREVAAAMGVSPEVVAAKVADLHEQNPMLGLRGCRLGITYPEITRMQVRAILEAACDVKAEGLDVHPEIMIPLVGFKKELDDQAAQVRAVAAEVFAERGVSVGPARRSTLAYSPRSPMYCPQYRRLENAARGQTGLPPTPSVQRQTQERQLSSDHPHWCELRLGAICTYIVCTFARSIKYIRGCLENLV
jgi:pyruvate,orthophosphate dikinase